MLKETQSSAIVPASLSGEVVSEYTPSQAELMFKLRKWYNRGHPTKPWFSFSGAAGTGKTYSIRAFIREMGFDEDEYICAAYVGKAVLNLIRGGLQAKTIHSLIYRTWVEQVKGYDDNGNPRIYSKMHTVLKDHLDKPFKVIIIDEATMVNDTMRDEILSFRIPVIFVGDMNQLPPIYGISSVMLHPDHVLREIMRQKEGDPIIQLSQMVLQGIPLSEGAYGESNVMTSIEMEPSLLTRYDQIICGKNKTREAINHMAHYEWKGIRNPFPAIGEKMVCRQNNWEEEVDGIYLTNGLIGTITDINRSKAHKGYLTIGFQPDFMDSPFEDLRLDVKYLTTPYQDKASYGISRYNKFEYAYAMSCHLMQGSQCPRVLFLDSRFWDAETTKKLRYTAITRAEQSVDIILHQYII